jgi:tartrate/fumarate subfamily iron-sulfur-dependent hydro-lyase beta chain
MSVYKLKTPLDKNEILKLKLQDTVYITGKLFTARDECHLKMLEIHKEGEEIPFNPGEMVLYHCGPVVKKENKKWKIISAGPTTSIRMELIEDEFLKSFKISMIIGKGGMGDKTLKALKDVGAVYAHYTGGVGALAAKAIDKILNVFYLDELGMPEAAWILDVNEFGPLTITMDAHGNSLYSNLDKRVRKNLEKVHAKIEK